MDPDETYYRMYDAMAKGQAGIARHYAEAMKDWLQKGGCYPKFCSQQEVDTYLPDVLRRTAHVEPECP